MNLQEIRDRLNKLNTKTGKRNDLWKPQDKHVIRLLPYPYGDEPILELGFHYDIGATRSMLCPKHNSGKNCPVCDLADKLRSWKDENGVDKPDDVRQADFELFKKIAVKQRWYAAMIDRADENPTPKFWSFGKTIYEKLLNMCLDEEMNEIAGTNGTDVLFGTDSAFDLTIDFKKPNNEDEKGNAKPWPVTDVNNRLKPSKLAKNKAECQAILDSVVNMKEVYPEVSPEEAEKIFNDFIGGGGAKTEVNDSGLEYDAKSAEKPVVGGQSIDEAFAELNS